MSVVIPKHRILLQPLTHATRQQGCKGKGGLLLHSQPKLRTSARAFLLAVRCFFHSPSRALKRGDPPEGSEVPVDLAARAGREEALCPWVRVLSVSLAWAQSSSGSEGEVVSAALRPTLPRWRRLQFLWGKGR